MKAELKINSVNQIIKGTNIYEAGDEIDSICLVVKGRIKVCAAGVNVLVGSGNFLALCDLDKGTHSVTYTADTNSVVYAFPKMKFNQAVRALMKANAEYSDLMYSTLNKYIRELSRNYDAIVEEAVEVYGFIQDAHNKYLEIAKANGVRVSEIQAITQFPDYDENNTFDIDADKIMYYRACCDIQPNVQKAFLAANATIPVYHITDQAKIVNQIIKSSMIDAEYLKKISGPLINDNVNLYSGVLQLAKAITNMGDDTTEVMSLFDNIIDQINSLENVLIEKAGIDINVDHEFMEEAYFGLINGGSQSDASVGSSSDAFALTEESFVSIDEMDGALDYILNFSQLEMEKANAFREYIEQFISLKDKFSNDDEVRTLRRNICKIYYDLYKCVFLQDYNSENDTPLVINLFLKYGYLSEKLVSESVREELLTIDGGSSGLGACNVYDMKEWLTEIYEGRKEPSKSEFDMDYAENLRDMRKTGRITAEQEQKLSRDKEAKLDYEINNMFKTNHRLIFGQVTAFVPFLFDESISGSIQRNFLSKDKINASVNRLLQIDYSVFYREGLFNEQVEGIKKEYIMEEVFPDFIVYPAFGSNVVMWQELSGRRRNSKGRFLVPVFLETDLDASMVKLFGRFRWELCRTMQGASWNNIQIKSLTSEYSDFIQFYRKNRELSEDKKEKLKMQIQKCRNNTREVFVVDYENWIKHEAVGGICLTKPVREILATYCPFTKEIREKVSEQPLYRDAMARFTRERGKKMKEYDMKFRVWEKDKVKIPEQIVKTRDFYTNM
ncbi:MAG: Crp/Fnr family transcriptional regulator [Lachnospiraceae bacterium]|nr:Crp/Fnr family transcriptional regulator [Lachnospiraceae bacterium]MBQ2320690.1 Crp/Fnr family transcriptional regulator [Lachnospiraceae bacterium]